MNRGDRVPAELKEVVLKGDVSVKDRAPDTGQNICSPLIGLCHGGPVDRSAAAELVVGQCCTVDLPVPGQWQLCVMHKRRRHHVVRQVVGQPSSQLLGRILLIGLVVSNKAGGLSFLGWWFWFVANLHQDLVDKVLVDVIVQLVKGGVPLLVAKPNVPAVGQGVVVVTTLVVVYVDTHVVDETVCRATGVRRPGPRRFVVEKSEDGVEGNVRVSVVVDELNLVVDTASLEGAHVKQFGDRIIDLVVGLPGLQHILVDLVDVVDSVVVHVGQPGFEQLPPGQTGDDVADTVLLGQVHTEGVDRLEAAVADVGEPVEAVSENLVHVLGRTDHKLNAEVVAYPAAVGKRRG